MNLQKCVIIRRKQNRRNYQQICDFLFQCYQIFNIDSTDLHITIYNAIFQNGILCIHFYYFYDRINFLRSINFMVCDSFRLIRIHSDNNNKYATWTSKRLLISDDLPRPFFVWVKQIHVTRFRRCVLSMLKFNSWTFKCIGWVSDTYD